MIVIFIGPPASGKGSQSDLLSEHLGIPHISTGDILRHEMEIESPLGISIKELMADGQYVTDDMIIEIVRDRIDDLDCINGFILDGFPRTYPQAVALEGMLGHDKVDFVFDLLVEDSVLFKRMNERAASENRTDDNPEKFQRRLQRFAELTEPLIQFYRDSGIKVVRIDANASKNKVSEQIKTFFQKS